MRCPKCGHENPSFSIYCGMCSENLEKKDVEDSRRAPTESSEGAIRCSGCGNDSPSGINFCSYCGMSLRTIAAPGVCSKCKSLNAPGLTHCCNCGETIVPIASEPGASVGRANVKRCLSCGIEIPGGGKNLCWSCIAESNIHTAKASQGEESHGLILAGGILLIVAGLIAIGQGLLYLAAGSMISTYDYSTFPLTCCAGLDLLFGCAAIGGGIFAVKQERFLLAIVGSVCALLSLGFLIGSLFGLLALIFIAVGKDSFSS